MIFSLKGYDFFKTSFLNKMLAVDYTILPCNMFPKASSQISHVEHLKLKYFIKFQKYLLQKPLRNFPCYKLNLVQSLKLLMFVIHGALNLVHRSSVTDVKIALVNRLIKIANIVTKSITATLSYLKHSWILSHIIYVKFAGLELLKV